MRVFWLSAPRWLYVPLYVALGWVAVWFLPDFSAAAGPALVWLIAAGGIAYTLGAVVYGFKRPTPPPAGSGSTRSSTSARWSLRVPLIAVFIAVTT